MRYPLFGVSLKGKSETVTAQRRVNLYAEIVKSPDKAQMALYPTPGLSLFAALSGPVRGWWVAKDRWFAVADAKFYEISSTGVATNRGMLSTNSGNVDMTDNGLQVLIVDGSNGYSFDLTTNILSAIGGAFPGGNTCMFDSGFCIVNKPGTGQFWWSASYDATSWNALDFATAESSPDNLVRVFPDQGQVILFGAATTEFWGASGATDLPYAVIGSATVEWGLAARWSVAKFNRAVICLMRNRLGQQQVVMLSGYLPTPVSTPDMEYEISQYSTVADAIGFSYNLAGHPMYEINFPTAGKTWLYDGLTNLWSGLESDGGRHWGNFGIVYSGQAYASDYQTGDVYVLSAQNLTDNGTPIAREVIGKHVFDEGYQRISGLWVEMQPGVGTISGAGEDPVAILYISRDGGFTYGSAKYASIGRMGQYKTRARWLRLGRSRDFVYKIRVTDPVYTVFSGAYLDAAA